jgi:hypothetical protein
MEEILRHPQSGTHVATSSQSVGEDSESTTPGRHHQQAILHAVAPARRLCSAVNIAILSSMLLLSQMMRLPVEVAFQSVVGNFTPTAILPRLPPALFLFTLNFFHASLTLHLIKKDNHDCSIIHRIPTHWTWHTQYACKQPSSRPTQSITC